jgi:hypothetical protein
VSSVFDYHRTDPDAEGRHGVRHVRTRVKAADSVVVKIADQLFRMDEAIGKKKVDDFTVYLKDVCGVAIVVRDEAEVRRVAQEIIKGRWTGKELEAAGVKVFDAARRFETFEVKEKLGKNDLSWRGIKIAGFWNGLCLEIQIKTEETLLREQAAHTAESHARYKTKREQMREHFAHDQPLYPFVRAYLRHLFIPGAPLPPAPETLTLKVGD